MVTVTSLGLLALCLGMTALAQAQPSATRPSEPARPPGASQFAGLRDEDQAIVRGPTGARRLALVLAGQELFVRAQQIGYRPNDTKLGMAMARGAIPDQFFVLAADSGKTRWRGPVKSMRGAVWGTFTNHAELDFTRFRSSGRFVLAVGSSRSLPFRIGPEVGAELPGQLLEFMRQQRCGYNPWLQTNCHPHDGRTAYGPLPAGSPIDVTGGWHDAGDLLKYHLTSGNATAQLLLAWTLAANSPTPNSQTPKLLNSSTPQPLNSQPPKLLNSDRFLARGDPGMNGVPDLLDEARWGLEWMLKMHPAPDQLYHQVADDRDHAGLRLPQNETVDYGWGKGGARVVYAADGRPQGLAQYPSMATGIGNIAGRFAAAMALAWQVWKDIPRERDFAERCLQAGREVYELGRAQEGFQQGNSCRAPYRYEETTWADDMEWGAAELFRVTGEPRYREDACRYAERAATESWMGLEQAAHYRYYPFLNVGHFRLHGLVDRSFQRKLEAFYREGLERCAAAARTNPYGVGVPFIWCSNNLVTALATQGLLYERMTGDRRFRILTARQRDWLLGRNPWGYTMFTEIGQVFPTDVHLMTTHLTGRRVRGGLVDGPVGEHIFKSLRGVSITEPDPLADFQDPRAVYHNDFKDYSTNEPTMDGTASAILLWALQATQE